MRATATPSPVRNGKRRLLSSCAIAAGIMALAYGGPAQAQVAGSALNPPGTVTIGTDAANHTTNVSVTDAQTIINWVPTDTTGTGDIDFLPSGSTWNFNGTGDYVVLNRFVNGAGGSLSRQIALNGEINSYIGLTSGTQGGSIWFYNAGGILIGSSGVINVGSLVLTTSDIDTSGGFFGSPDPTDPTVRSIRFMATTPGSTRGVTVNGEIHANQLGAPGSSYVALVAPRVTQAGRVEVYGSAAYVAAEAADITMNAGLFDIQVGVGATGGQAITHTGITTGPEQQASGPAQRIYMVAIPKNDAVTMLVSGQVGYQDAAASAQTDSDGRVILSAGYDVTSNAFTGEAYLTRNPAAAAADITVNDIIFRSNVEAHASGAFLGQPFGVVPTGGPFTFVPPPQQGRFAIQGDGFFTGDTSATLTINAGRVGFVTGNLSVVSGGNATTPGDAAINVAGGQLSVQGLTSISAPGFFGTATGDTQGGSAGLTITNGGQMIASGGLSLSADAFGGFDDGGLASGDGTGGSVTLTVAGAGSSLSGGDIYLHANGYGALPSSGFDIADTGGAGTGGTATVRVQNGASLSTTAGLTLEANGQGGFGLDQSGIGHGGDTLVEATGANSLLQASQTSLAATGIGGGGDVDDPLTGPVASQNGGEGIGGTATLRFNATGTSPRSTGLTDIDVSAAGGSAGDFDAASGENARGGDATGGDAVVEVLGGNAQMTSLTINASAVSGEGRSGSGTTARSGDAEGGTIAISAVGAGSVLGLSGGSVLLDASGTAATGLHENAGSGSGGTIGVSATTGGTISGMAILSGNAFGGSSNISPLLSAGTGTGGSVDFLADTGGTLSAQAYQARANGSVVNTDGNNGAARGGNVSIIARGGGTVAATAAGVSELEAAAIDGISADGSTATGGGIRMIADGGAIRLRGLTLNADATSGRDDPGSASLATGGTIAIGVGAGANSILSVDTLEAQANGIAGAYYDGFVSGPGDARGGTITLDMQGGSLTTSTSTTGIALSADGIGGDGSEGRGGSVAFTQTGGAVTTGNVLITANGEGGEAGNGIGRLATLSLTGGTFNANGGSVVVTANGEGGQGLTGNDDPDFGRDGGTGGLGQGGTATITIGGTAVVNAGVLGAYASGTGGSGGDFFTDGLEAGAGGAGGTGNGGLATLNLISGSLTSDIVVAEARGNGGTGGTMYSSSSTGPSIGGGVGGDGGAAAGGTATLNLGTTALTLGPSGGLSARAIATGGQGGNGPSEGTGGDGGLAEGGTAQAIIDNHDAGQLTLALDSSATGGNGGFGDSGDAGNGGDAIGGTARVEANGADAEAVVSQSNFLTSATGGNGGTVFGDSLAAPTVAGRGGNGGFGAGGIIEVAASNGATIGLSGDFSSSGTGGNGGNGGNNLNAPMLTGGDGGTGGGALGGIVHLFANGGTVTSDGAPVAITVGGVSGAGGNGGTGSGSDGNFGGTVADQGGTVVIEALTTPGGTGGITLGDTSIQANGSLAGRIELRADNSAITMNSLTAEATGYAEPVNGNTTPASPGIFLTATGGSIATTAATGGDMTLRTNGGVDIDAQGDGQVSATGNLTIDAFDTVHVTHTDRGAAPTLSAAGDLSISSGLNINADPGTLLSAGGTLTLQGIGPVSSVIADRISGNDIVITANDLAVIEHAEAVDDFLANTYSFRTGLNSIIAGGDIDINVVTTADLGNSTAGGHIAVTARSIDFNNANAGTFVSLNASGTGATDGIVGTNITADGGVSLNGRSVDIDGTVQSGQSLFVTANTGNAAIGLANVAGDISVFAGTDLSGTYRAGGNVNLNANGNVTAEADAAGGYVDPSGSFTSEGYVFAEADGNVTLTNSSAATMLGVQANGAASLTGASAGEDVFVLAGTTATLSGITAGDDLTVQANGLVSVTNAATTGTGRDDRSIVYAPIPSSPTISFLQIVTTPADLSNIMLTGDAGIAAANVRAFNNLTATSGGTITATGPLVAGGNLDIGAVGAVNLADATAGGFIDIDGQSIAFDALDAGGYVDLDTTTSEGDPGTVTGVSIVAGADVHLAGSSIDTDSVTAAASLSATGTTGAVAIDNAAITGNISVLAAGNISGTYSAGGDALLSAGGNVVASVSATGGYPDSSNPDLPSGGNVYVDAAGNVTLTDSSAGGMFGVNGRSVALTNAAAGEDMLILAQGPATLSEISVGDDLDVRATGAVIANDVSATGLGPDGFLLNYSPTGGFTIGQGEGSTSLDGADIDLRSSGASVGASGLSAGDDIFLTAATTIALNGAETLGLGVTGGDSSIRTSGGDTTLAGLDAFSDVVVDAAGTANVTGSVQAGRDIAINAGNVQLADLATPGGNALQTLTAGRDVVIASAAGIDGGRITGQGNVTLTANGAIAVTGVASGGDMNLAGATGIAADRVESGGATTLASSDGLINLGSLTSTGDVDASGDSLFIGDGGNLTFANLVTDVGDAAVRTSGDLVVVNGNIAGRVDLASAGERISIDTLTANSANISATNGSVTLNNVTVTSSLNANAFTSVQISGIVTGENITLASGDIEIGSAARVGTAGVTQGLSFQNSNNEQQTFVGGTGTRDGYHIDADELTRVFGNNVDIFAPEVFVAAPSLVGGTAQPDVVVDDFTMTAGGSGANLGATGSLSIFTPGKMRVLGDVQLTGLSDTNALNLRADTALEVLLGQGSVRLVGANDAPGGQLNMRSRDIIVATPEAIDDVANATTLEAIETRLAQNDGITLDEGALFARGMNFNGNAYVQNSGSGTDYAQRRGLTFGAGGLNVATEGNARIVLNGVHLGPNGQVTGLDTIPLLTINGGGVVVPSDLYNPAATFNGCLIAGVAACSFVPPEQPDYESNFPVQDVIEKEVDGDDDSGDGTSLPTALITMRALDPLTGEPLLDDPVTGAGNDDLWTPTTDTQP
ncbi:hypothetical protein [Sphingopyxis sp. DBS4]|uniref:hypothetical protein n=1 Tax=Sphingopyxis sp. DBS4 TaxID=2968500 RepID=UPI00214CC862|nr:hypothetical protein [Sphingopyxis sp. DBS4]